MISAIIRRSFMRPFLRCFCSLKKIRTGRLWALLFSFVVGVALADYVGLFTHLLEKDYFTEFTYPLEINVVSLIEKLRKGEIPSVQQITTYPHEFLKITNKTCHTNARPRLLYLIKSAMPHSERRMAIRHTWGYERRFSDVEIRTFFLLGINPSDRKIQELIDKESWQYQDIIQANFVDTYGNNTLKAMAGLKWVVEFCPAAQYVVFADDDFYLSTKNLLRFIRNPKNYPDYLELPVSSLFWTDTAKDDEKPRKQAFEKEQRNLQRFAVDFGDYGESVNNTLYAGYVFHSPPQRFRASKWYVPLEEYPYTLWPPYVSAGAFVVSQRTLFDLYYASFYTQFFRFDDIYLGLIAKKASIIPLHCSHFYFWKKYYTVDGYRHVIASHGYGDPEELKRVWQEQKSAGNA